MRRTRHMVLPVRSWQYIGLMIVSLACLTLGLVSRDREGQSGSLAGPELKHRAPHEVDACPNKSPFDRLPSYDDPVPISRHQLMAKSKENDNLLASEELYSTIGESRASRISRVRSLAESRSQSSRRSSRISSSIRAQWTTISSTGRTTRDRIDSRTGLESSRHRIADIHSRDAKRVAPSRELRPVTKNLESLARVRRERESDRVARSSRNVAIDRNNSRARISRTIDARDARTGRSVGNREIRLSERDVRFSRDTRSSSDSAAFTRSLERLQEASTSRFSREARSLDPSTRDRVQERANLKRRILQQQQPRETVRSQTRIVERQSLQNSQSREDLSRSSGSQESPTRNSRSVFARARSVDRRIRVARQERNADANRRSTWRDLEERRPVAERRIVSDRRLDVPRTVDRRNVRSIDRHSRASDASRRPIDFDKRESRSEDRHSRSHDRTSIEPIIETTIDRAARRLSDRRSSRLRDRNFRTPTTTNRNDRTLQERAWIDSLRSQRIKNVRSIDERRSLLRQVKETDRTWSYDRIKRRSDRGVQTTALAIGKTVSTRDRTDVRDDLARVSNERIREERTARHRMNEARSTSLIFVGRNDRTTSKHRENLKERYSNPIVTIDGRTLDKIGEGRWTGSRSRESLREFMSRASSKILMQQRLQPVSSYEILRQTLILALCIVYGTSIYNGKNSLFGNFIRRASRFVVQ